MGGTFDIESYSLFVCYKATLMGQSNIRVFLEDLLAFKLKPTQGMVLVKKTRSRNN